jgi:hypothetical protein
VGKSRLLLAKTPMKMIIVGGLLELFGGTFRMFLMINPLPHPRFPERS